MLITRLLARPCSTMASSSQTTAHEPTAVAPRKPRVNRDIDRSFVDYRRVKCTGGSGGDGCLSFLRVFANPFAGPDGGDGGHGAHVIFKAAEGVTSLCDIPATIRARSGYNGQNKNRHGANANHLCLKVPVGTFFRRVGSDRVFDLNKEDDIFIAARGGSGGHGNKFYLSNEVRAPMKTEAGVPGETISYDVELRTIAHAGLVGFPNAGKSTLLRAVSRASPKVSAIPFTTLRPYVGTILYDDHVQLRMADIPGLVCGASEGYGLGLDFLRHVHRCQALFYVLDLSLAHPADQLHALQNELEAYSPGLSKRPLAIIGNKVDLPQSRGNLECLAALSSLPVFPISAKFRTGLHPLLAHFRRLYDAQTRNTLE